MKSLKKKLTSKVAHNRPQTFFHSTGPAAQTSPVLIFHIINMSQDSSVCLSVVRTETLMNFEKISPRNTTNKLVQFYGVCLLIFLDE